MLRKAGVTIGEVFENKTGEKYEVINYAGAHKGVTIRFLSTGNTMLCSTKEVKSGSIKNCMQKSVYGAGCFGEGPYKAKINGKFTAEYQLWIGVMTRIYYEPTLVKHPNYRNVSVAEEWLNFQNFAAWCQEQTGFKRTEPNGRRYMLDKDLLVANNKTYSASTCCFLPHQINVALQGRQHDKSDSLPSGVYWHNASNSYTAGGQKFGRQYHLGCFADPTDAVKVFRDFKKAYLVELAELHKADISQAAYNALLDFNMYARFIYDTAGA